MSNEIHRYNTRNATKGNYCGTGLKRTCHGVRNLLVSRRKKAKEAKLEIFKLLFSRTGAKVWKQIPSDRRDTTKSVF